MFKTYPDVLTYMYQSLPMYQRVGPSAYKNDLTNTIALCKALGNPENKFKSVHIAGTNGKGSSAHMLAAVLQCSGYTTGLYTSPHLKDYTERIRINGKAIDESSVIDFINEIQPVLDNLHPSFFETTVAMAFRHFERMQVDIAVIEVGLGGRLDSTNVIHPEVSLITNISFDHKDILGDTLQKIAAEKAGIIKQEVPVVISEHQNDTDSVFLEKARNENAALTFATDRLNIIKEGDGFNVDLDGRPWLRNLVPDLKGLYQERNIGGVLATILQLRNKGWKIPDDAVRQGLSRASSLTGLKGRWQTLLEKPLTICDTGHNPAGIKEVLFQLAQTSYKKLHFVFGTVNDKDPSEILALLPTDATYYFCQAKIPRAMDAAALFNKSRMFGLTGKCIPDVNDAVREAISSAEDGDLVFIGGSTFVVGELELL